MMKQGNIHSMMKTVFLCYVDTALLIEYNIVSIKLQI